MAKNMQPILKRCKTLGLSPAVLGYSKSTNRHQKQQFRRKQSEYATQLNEKQKVKFIYGVLEKQFHASTRREARQLVNHGHFTVNGKRVNIPSFQVKLGDVVAICEKSRSSVRIKTILEEQAKRACPKWLEKANDGFEGKVIALPVRDDIDYEVAEHLIVELYSK